MTKAPLNRGDIITYPYRWARMLATGSAPEGGKDRPCCVVITIVSDEGEEVIFLAAISSQEPLSGQAAIEIPDTERRRAGLTRYPRAWVYIGELNRDEPARSWFLEPQDKLGAFSKPFRAKITSALQARLGAITVVNRR
jgi:hypothetical protein